MKVQAPTPGQASFEARQASRVGRMIAGGPGRKWRQLSPGQQADEEAGAQAAIEAGPNAPERLAKGNTRLREENNRLHGRLQAVRQVAEQTVASGIIDGHGLLDLLDVL